MSRNIVLYIAASLDGYIARANGGIDWLLGNSENPDTDFRYEQFYSTIDTVIMGRTTYEQLVNELSPDVWVYEGKKCYVASSMLQASNDRVKFVSGDIGALAQSLKTETC